MKMNKLLVKKTNIDEFLFFVAYSMYLVTAFFHISFYASYISKYGKTIMLLCAIVIVFKELFVNKIRGKELIGLLICIILSLILFLHVNGYLMFPFFVLIYGARRIKFKKIAKFSFFLGIIMLAFIIISAKSGIILDYVSYVNGRERHFLGFRYALYPSMVVFNLTALYLYINDDAKIVKCIIPVVLNYILFKYTDSRLTFYLSVFTVFLVTFVKKHKSILDDKKIVSSILCISYIICSIVSLYLICSYSSMNNTLNDLDITLEHRLSLGKKSIEIYPINLLGHDVEFIGAGLSEDGTRSKKAYNYVDCMYLNMIEKYGIIYFLIYISILTYTTYQLKKTKNYILLIILCMYALMGMIDDLGLFLHYNTFVFLIGTVIGQSKGELI